jgi:hypothetical protein
VRGFEERADSSWNESTRTAAGASRTEAVRRVPGAPIRKDRKLYRLLGYVGNGAGANQA